ncbi:MAG: GNAT family N-acetyltransferase [Candidatus Saccharimonadales bacterium]
MRELQRLTNEQLLPLLVESEYAFLPTKTHPDETAISLQEKFRNDTRYDTLGYVLGNKALSYITALSGRTADEIAIGPMYVAESSRGNGLGKLQVVEFVELFAEHGYASIYTKTWLGNIASRRSFESLGFIEMDRKDDDRADGDSTISYTLQIHRQ